MLIEKILKIAIKGGASDVILKVDNVPKFRKNGDLFAAPDGELITAQVMKEWIEEIMPKNMLSKLTDHGEFDFAFAASFGSRFRVNLFQQQRQWAMVLRVINPTVRTVEELQLPKICDEIANMKRGLVLVTGATGSGKTTTLAAILQKINFERPAHIITIEDPIEYVYKENRSTINQREVGVDTDNFSVALRAALRQNPDVILVGELRDKETTETAIMAAETGHLVLSTLHTLDSADAMNRILGFFPPHQHKILKNQLSSTLRVVMCQRLLPKKDGTKMIPAMEVMIVNEMIRNLIIESESMDSIRDTIINNGDQYGMMSFDMSILSLLTRGLITDEVALRAASSPANLRLLLDGVGSK